MPLFSTHLQNDLDIQIMLYHASTSNSLPVKYTVQSITAKRYQFWDRLLTISTKVCFNHSWTLTNDLLTNLSVMWIGTRGKSLSPGIDDVRCWKSVKNIDIFIITYCTISAALHVSFSKFGKIRFKSKNINNSGDCRESTIIFQKGTCHLVGHTLRIGHSVGPCRYWVV